MLYYPNIDSLLLTGIHSMAKRLLFCDLSRRKINLM